MDKVIEAARALGKALQSDERYIRYNTAQQQNDEDEALQALIGEFSQKRDELSEEAQKDGRDNDRVTALNAEVKELYAKIFQNGNMAAFSTAREDFQQLITFVNQIITGSSNGLDPDTIEFQQGCGGSCSSCAGCN